MGREIYRVHFGVHAVGRPAKTPLEHAAAAVLACGPAAGLSHFSALALWGYARCWPDRFEVSISGNRRPAGIGVHRSNALTRRDFTTHHGIRVTSPARTLLDCSPSLCARALARTVNEALLSPYMSRSARAELLHGRAPPGPRRI